MFYQLEKDLQNDLQNLVSDYEIKKRSNTYVRREVPVGECVPDLVTVKFHKNPTIKKWPRKWSAIYSYFLWIFRKWNHLSIEELSEKYFDTPKRIQPYINDLLKYELINESEGYYFLSPEYLKMDVEVIAFEAKLFRWHEALNQGIRYSQFANKVYVVMDPEGLPKRDSSLDLFRKHGIGLCGISNSSFNIIIKAKNNLEVNYENEYLINSTLLPARQTFWSCLNSENASHQFATCSF